MELRNATREVTTKGHSKVIGIFIKNSFEDVCVTMLYYNLLTKVDLSERNIAILPEDFCNLCSLKECYLSQNILEELPYNFFNLTNLRVLRLDSNNLTYISHLFDEMTNLETLDLYNNEIEDIYCDTERFRSLDVALNQMHEPKTEVYEKQKSLLRTMFGCELRSNESKLIEKYRPIINSAQSNGEYREEIWDSDGSWELDFKVETRLTPQAAFQKILNESIAMGRFCPVDMHPKKIVRTPYVFEYEPGQCDDAESDEN